jgi:hypothetical protein
MEKHRQDSGIVGKYKQKEPKKMPEIIFFLKGS